MPPRTVEDTGANSAIEAASALPSCLCSDAVLDGGTYSCETERCMGALVLIAGTMGGSDVSAKLRRTLRASDD